MKIICVIPARLKSTRFPKKILCDLLGKPLLVWVYEAAKATGFFDQIVFAIDSIETKNLLEKHGLPYHMTPEDLDSGTARLAYLCQNHLEKADLWVNWQADEPLISQKMIQDLLQVAKNTQADVYTLKKYLESEAEVHSKHICKVVSDKRDRALYFSRSALPASRDGKEIFQKMFKHVGLYAYPESTLKTFFDLEACPYEEDEKLEQIRFLFNGLHVALGLTQEDAFGIDLEEHVKIAESRLLQQKKMISIS